MSNQKAKRIANRKKQKRTMPLFLVGIGGLFLILLAILLVKGNQPTPKAALEVAGAPALKVDKENVDLGNIKLGNTVEVAFTLTNVGDQPLKLTEAPYVEVVEGC